MSGHTLVQVQVRDVVVIPRGMGRIWCVRGRVVLPVASIRDVRLEDAPYGVPTG